MGRSAGVAMPKTSQKGRPSMNTAQSPNPHPKPGKRKAAGDDPDPEYPARKKQRKNNSKLSTVPSSPTKSNTNTPFVFPQPLAKESDDQNSPCPIDWALPTLSKITPNQRLAYELRKTWTKNKVSFADIQKFWCRHSGSKKTISLEGVRKGFWRANEIVYHGIGIRYELPPKERQTMVKAEQEKTGASRFWAASYDELEPCQGRPIEHVAMRICGQDGYTVRNYTGRTAERFKRFPFLYSKWEWKRVKAVYLKMARSTLPRSRKVPLPYPVYYHYDQADDQGRYPSHPAYNIEPGEG
ncbi:hypothetical protein K469DRAFT_689830 [Zopfia rhizophila CBS 207.26]|uniref:Uncharacterized protein n=1 Tax=Zopfia rhizophila CBS 207.26 TaxID=1314779 RepID=A0A6A6E1B7_9PEZI|nr:hypothetical protein K469DRAFT_689830 [Zopfia rhizophila CBS 207.26]